MAALTVDKGLASAGLLVAAGLIVELTLTWFVHPLAFVGFLLIACPLVLAGMLVFFWTLVATDTARVR